MVISPLSSFLQSTNYRLLDTEIHHVIYALNYTVMNKLNFTRILP